MVPSSAILRRFEGIRPVIARCDRTLGYAANTVHVVRSKLSNAVPVYAGAVFREGVLDGDLYGITPVRVDNLLRVSKDMQL